MTLVTSHQIGGEVDLVEDIAHVFYFAGRAVAQWTQRYGGGDTLLYLATGHLGTPIQATDEAGATIWQGGLDPFGAPFAFPRGGSPQEGDEETTASRTSATMQEAGIFLRFPGQWDDSSFQAHGLRGGLYYNVHRYYSPGTGRYTRPDPAWSGDFHDTNPYVYALANPANFGDLNGLDYFPTFLGGGYLENQSSCPVFAFGDLGPRTLSQPIIVPAGRVYFYGLMRDIGRTSFLGDVDFVCLGGKWSKIRGPAWVNQDRRLHGVYHRPANAEELSRLPPCTDPPCQCEKPQP